VLVRSLPHWWLEAVAGLVGPSLLVAGCQRRVEEPHVVATASTPLSTAAPVLPPSAQPTAAAVADQLAPAPSASESGPTAAGAASSPAPGGLPSHGFRFAVIGDYGAAGPAERQVADLVKAFKPELVITTGDNNYPMGGADTIDANIGQFYADFIAPYHGKYGKGARENRFFPALGNHDWYTDDAKPYLDYFTLPGNERYYRVSRGGVDFYALDSDPHEPDGTTATSKQADWLKAEVAKSRSPWHIAYMHHPPYSSGPHGSTPELAWPYHEWGIDVVLAGHDHTYERASVNGLTYLVNGLGGNQEYQFKQPVPMSQFRYNDKSGAQLCTATPSELRLTFVNVDGTRIDDVVLKHDR
jgi:tartrate-resistant acid phosphatase type 5